MPDLTFGEQVKIVLSRKGMTIKELAELIEKRTGKKMSRQNLTQRLSRDNFQEQDMRMIAAILECPLHLSILDADIPTEKINKKTEKKVLVQPVAETEPEPETEITVDELLDEDNEITVEELLREVESIEAENREDTKAVKGPEEVKEKPHGLRGYLQRRKKKEPVEEVLEETEEPEMEIIDVLEDEPEMPAEEPITEPVEEVLEETEEPQGDINPYTGREYETNSVRSHPSRIGYVQVYDREEHKWTDMTEWAFLGYQERKKMLLGKDYEPPIYLD
ncbi:hypothetical protein [Faecalicatena contorta]|uniref:hypothetical protein n=1 Tax=Faecalicatena contorta TaxID=39482 RepID=UPI001F3E21E3|nr:hypothetical protein [Faecalicatena contorta]MCF2555718.1 hypothetical protein [Faecalicatena contorta]MCF2680689.1 hypothetical protein [Faecalicatena contorta]